MIFIYYQLKAGLIDDQWHILAAKQVSYNHKYRESPSKGSVDSIIVQLLHLEMG